MLARLVLGCGTLGYTVLDALDERSASDDLRVVHDDESRVDALRNEGIDARAGDPGDADVVAAAGPADVVFVGGDDPATNRRAVEAAGNALAATLVAYVGDEATAAQRRAITGTADHAIRPGAAVLEALSAVGTADVARRRGLRDALLGVEGTLGVVPHANPDPDALASAVALVRLARTFGVPAEVCYYGEIAHQENRALVNRLDYDLRSLGTDEVPDCGAVALVDHSTPGVNDHLPRDLVPAIVVDHHPTDRPVRGEFVDVRVDAGATSTLLVDYLRGYGLTPDEDVATGLLYGIRVDTREFTRETTAADFEAAAYVLPHVDPGAVEQIESPNVSGDTLDTIARAIRNRRIEGATLVSCVGAISDRDTLSQAADRLLTMDGVDTTLVCGFDDGTVHASARTRGTDIDLGAALRDAFGDMGSAGGHADMAGAQIPLGLFSTVESEAESSLSEILTSVVAERFFAAVAADPTA